MQIVHLIWCLIVIMTIIINNLFLKSYNWYQIIIFQR